MEHTYLVQYSVPGNNPAVSEWMEYTKKIKAHSDIEAIEGFEKNRNGTWMILDCYPE